MSAYLARASTFASEPVVMFYPTQACGDACKRVWGQVPDGACQHGVHRSPQCSGECRQKFVNLRLCLHAALYCHMCGESRWPKHGCYCVSECIDPKMR